MSCGQSFPISRSEENEDCRGIRTLRRFPVIMMMQTEEQWLLFDLTGGVIIMRRSIGNGFQSLMRSVVVVIVNIFFDDSVELRIVEDDEIVETFGTNGADKSFSVSVQVWRVRNSRNTCDVVLVIGKMFELTGVVRTASVL